MSSPTERIGYDDRQPFPWGRVSLLGVATIVAYGSWYYAFGVLLDPIVADTGWTQSWVVAAFGASGIAGSLAAPYGGRAIDRFSPRLLFVVTGITATAAFSTASVTDSLVVFAVATSIGGAVLAGFGFYHVAQTVAIRAAPLDVARAVGLVTLFGAFASTIYLPLTAWLVTTYDWRVALRVLAVLTGVVLVIVGVFTDGGVNRSGPTVRVRWRNMLDTSPKRRYATASAAIGVATGIILVYQVPLMTDAGLTLTTAAWLAGLRGTTQFLGRLPVTQLVQWLGTNRALQTAFGAITVGAGLLGLATSPAIGMAYVVVAGFGIGATSPLQGIYGTELFDPKNLGHGMGIITMVFGLSTAISPAAVSVLNDMAASRWWAVGIAVVAGGIATVALRPPNSAPAPPSTSTPVDS
ncbi:MAG: MFS transporter [Acidimicrobiia bacterium]|nr:MFS transporter [Acidimicrobiia bacterium]